VVDAGARTVCGAAEPPRAGAVELQEVRFGYDGVPVLGGVTLVVDAGAHVAVVGTTGSGKSTLAALIAGVRAPDGGRVLLSGVPVGTIDGARRARAVAMVSQETHVFAGTVADNLRLGAPAAGEAEVRSALDAVGASAWVDGLPQGAATRVGAGGHPLTPQQAQHLALARLLLVDPAVAVLDEATAEAGSDVARTLDEAARDAIRGRTAIVVAHRLDQAAEADLVVVMEDGAIVEAGAPDELIERGGHFAALWNVAASRHDVSDRR